MDNGKNIQIFIAQKTMRRIDKPVKEIPFILAHTPHTLRELIEEAVKTCISAYRQRTADADRPHPLTDEELDGMQEIGKIAFGVHYNENKIDEAQAIDTAICAMQDGLVRVFRENVELTALDEPFEIAARDRFTFVRLTMLTGRMW